MMGWKGWEVQVLKGWEMGEIGGNYATMFNISQSKQGTKGCQEKKGQEPGMKSMGGKRFGPQDSKAKLGAHKQGNELLAWLIIKKTEHPNGTWG